MTGVAPASTDDPRAADRAPTRLPAAQRRAQLLDAALATFAERGFDGASMNDVAEAAGVTKPVLYQHFASKQALYRELVDDIGARLETAIMDVVVEAGTGRQQVEAGFRAFFRWATGEGEAFRVLFADRNRTDRDLAAAVAKVEQMMVDRVAELIAIEGLTPDERQVLAFGVVGVAEATSRQWLRLGLGPGEEADACADRVAQLVWAGLRGVGR